MGVTFPEPPADYPAGAAGTAQGHSPLRAPQPPARRSPPPGPPTQVTELGQEGRRAPRLAGREEIGGDTPLPSRSARAPGSALVLGAPSAGLGVDWVPCDGRFGDPESGCPVRVSRPRPHCGQEGPEPPPPPRGPVPPGSAPQEGRGGERAAAPGSLITSVRSAPLRAASCLAIPANSIPQSIGERPAFRGEQSRLGEWGAGPTTGLGAGRSAPRTTAAGNSGLGAGGPATWGLGVELGGGDPTQERVTLPGSPSSAGSQRSAPSRRGKPSLLLPLPPKPTSLPVVGVPQVEVGSPWTVGGESGGRTERRGGSGCVCSSGWGEGERNKAETSLFTKYIFNHVKSGIGYRQTLATAEGQKVGTEASLWSGGRGPSKICTNLRIP